MPKTQLDSQIVVVSKYGILPGYGMNSRIFNVAKKLSDHYNVTLITSDSNHLASYPRSSVLFNTFYYDKLNTIWIKTLKYRTSRSLKRLLTWLDFEFKLRRLRFIQGREPKLIIISSLSLLTIMWALRLKKKYGSKVIFEIRDFYPLTLTSEFGISKYNPVVMAMGYIEKQGLNKADLIVGTMPLIDDYVYDIIKKRRPTFYSPNGLSVYTYSTDITEEVDSAVLNFIDQFDKIIIYSGSMGYSNNLGPLIDVIFHTSKFNLKNYGFLFVGDGDLKKLFSEKLKDNKNVFFTGRIPPKMVYSYLRLADILYLSVKPSIPFQYGQSLNKVLDYLYVGKPLVATYDGFPNILSEVDGYKLTNEEPSNIANAFLEIAQYDDFFLESIKINAKRLLESRFTYEVITEDYLDVVNNLID